MSAFGKFMKLFSLAGGVRSTIDPITGGVSLISSGNAIAMQAAGHRLQRPGRSGAVLLVGGNRGSGALLAGNGCWHHCMSAEAPFARVRIAIPNWDTVNTLIVNKVAVAATDNISNGSGIGSFNFPSAGAGGDNAWLQATFNGGTAPQVIPAATTDSSGAVIPSIITTDWMPLASIAAVVNSANPNGLPLLLFRYDATWTGQQAYFLPAEQSTWFTNWDNGPLASTFGRVQKSAIQAGQFSTVGSGANTTGWNAGGNFNQSTNFGAFGAIPQFDYIGRAVSILGVGDSIMMGQYATVNESGYFWKACCAASSVQFPVTAMNCGTPGVNYQRFSAYAKKFIATFKPDIVVMPMNTPNASGAPPYCGFGSQQQIDGGFAQALDLLDTVIANSGTPILVTSPPTHYRPGSGFAGAPSSVPVSSDPFWIAHNQRVRAMASHGFVVADIATVLTAPDGYSWADALTDSTINTSFPFHPNEAGHNAAAAVLQAAINYVIAANG